MAVRRGGTFPIEVYSVTYGASLSVTTTLPQERTHGGRKGQGVHARARGAGSHASRHTHTHTHISLQRQQPDFGLQRTTNAYRFHSRASASDKGPAMACFCKRQRLLHRRALAHLHVRARAHTHTHNTPTRAPREHTDSSLKPCDAGAPRPLASHQHRTPAPHMPRHAPVSLTTPGLAHERDGH